MELGQSQLGPAFLHKCEGCSVHNVDFYSTHSDLGSRSAEEALMNAFREAGRSVTSILYLPHLQLWCAAASKTLKKSFIIAMKDLPPDLSLLVLATATFKGFSPEDGSIPTDECKPTFGVEFDFPNDLFNEYFQLTRPSQNSLRKAFQPIISAAKSKPKTSKAVIKRKKLERMREILPKSPLLTINLSKSQMSMEELEQKQIVEDR